MNINFKYRTWGQPKTNPLNRIKLEVPGWAGTKNSEFAQPYMCKPFVDGTTYGYEILYPFDTEIRVRCDNDEGVCQFLTESNKEWELLPGGLPMANFAPNHFGFTSSLDIQTEDGWGTMILPHPRYYTDRTGTVPLPVHGLIESDIWTKIFFIAFRAPIKGFDYVFRKGEGIAHVIFVPKEVNYNCQKMSEEEVKIREKCDKALSKCSSSISTKQWKDKNNHMFDNKYKVISQIAKKDGPQAVLDYLSNLLDSQEKEQAIKSKERLDKFQFRLIKSEKNVI